MTIFWYRAPFQNDGCSNIWKILIFLNNGPGKVPKCFEILVANLKTFSISLIISKWRPLKVSKILIFLNTCPIVLGILVTNFCSYCFLDISQSLKTAAAKSFKNFNSWDREKLRKINATFVYVRFHNLLRKQSLTAE